MNENEFDRAARTWLEDGPTQLSDRALLAALEEVHGTRQRRFVWPTWMSGRATRLSFALAVGAAALVVIAAATVLFASVAHRLDATVAASPSALTYGPASGGMWPQANGLEAGQAQDRADAGDPAYTWQIDPELASPENLYPWRSEIVARFLRERLGWEQWAIGKSGVWAGQSGGPYEEVELIRCAAGRTNPLYAEMPDDVRGCAPTIDDYHYETVTISIGQPWRVGPTGIWAITRWQMETAPPPAPQSMYDHLTPDRGGTQVVQVAPPAAADVDALLDGFLQARLAGRGAEAFIHRHPEGWDDEETPLLYATTGGSRWASATVERVQGPVWPAGWIEIRVHLVANDGTKGEQSFIVVRQEDGKLGLMYGTAGSGFATTENGRPPGTATYNLLDGEITFTVASPPWSSGWEIRGDTPLRQQTFDLDRSAMNLAVDPAPVDAACQARPLPASAAALAEALRANPAVDATAPLPVQVAGMDGLQLDIAFHAADNDPARCGEFGLAGLDAGTGNLPDGVMRLTLVDLPAGMSARILAIGVAAPDPSQACAPELTPCFDQVMTAASPTLDSLQVGTP